MIKKKKYWAILKRLQWKLSPASWFLFLKATSYPFLVCPARNGLHIHKLYVSYRKTNGAIGYTWRFPKPFERPALNSCKKASSFETPPLFQAGSVGEGSNLQRILLLLEKLCRSVEIMQQAYKSLLQLYSYKEKFISSPTRRAAASVVMFITGLRSSGTHVHAGCVVLTLLWCTVVIYQQLLKPLSLQSTGAGTGKGRKKNQTWALMLCKHVEAFQILWIKQERVLNLRLIQAMRSRPLPSLPWVRILTLLWQRNGRGQ